MKRVKTNISINGIHYKNVYIKIEAVTDCYGNVIKTIKQNDKLQIGISITDEADGIQDKPKNNKSVAKPKSKSKSKSVAKKPIKKVVKTKSKEVAKNDIALSY
jgi:hypothetical protein